MSTRSFIAKELPNGNYKTIYCHFDGYIDHNGVILNDFYNTEKKVDELLNLGNLSTLGVVMKPDKKYEHTFDNPQKYVCVAYSRDREETNQEAKEITLHQMLKDIWIEYFYIFNTDGKWMVSNAYFPNEKDVDNLSKESLLSTFKPLDIEVEKECTNERRLELKKIFESFSSGEEM